MTNVETKIPDALYRQAQTIAEREQISLDEFIALAVAGQISAWETGRTFHERSKSGKWQKAQKILANAPDTEPESFDKL